MSRALAYPGMAQATEEAANKPTDVVDIEQDAGSGGPSTDLARESSAASPRLIPAPNSPPRSIQLPPAPPAGEHGAVPASSDRNCALSGAPTLNTANYDQLPYGQFAWDARGARLS